MGIRSGNHFGIERYDWHLCASVVSEVPMPVGPQPYSLIGLDLNDGTLFPDQQGKIVALLDFEREAHFQERQAQTSALRNAGIPFIELKGRYSIRAIRKLYRRCAFYFLAHRESFGLPICETQACGSYVFTPVENWCPSHWQKDDLYAPGVGQLTKNFIVYNNDPRFLADELSRLKTVYDAQAVRQRFLREHGSLFYGDIDELNRFVGMVRSGEINSELHHEHQVLV
jgi:hypothetical protein